MTFTIKWWISPMILFISPFIYGSLRKNHGDHYDMEMDTLVVALSCWFFAIGILLGKFLL